MKNCADEVGHLAVWMISAMNEIGCEAVSYSGFQHISCANGFGYFVVRMNLAFFAVWMNSAIELRELIRSFRCVDDFGY